MTRPPRLCDACGLEKINATPGQGRTLVCPACDLSPENVGETPEELRA